MCIVPNVVCYCTSYTFICCYAFANVYKRNYPFILRVKRRELFIFVPANDNSFLTLSSYAMKAVINSVRLMGRLGMDPDMKTFDSGRKMARLSLATNDVYKTGEGERVTDTQWHNL